MLGFGRSRCRGFAAVESLLVSMEAKFVGQSLLCMALAQEWWYVRVFEFMEMRLRTSGCFIFISKFNGWLLAQMNQAIDCPHLWHCLIFIHQSLWGKSGSAGPVGYYSVEFNPVVMFDGVLFRVWKEILIKVAKVVAAIHLSTPRLLRPQHLLRPLTLLWFSLQNVQINPRFTVSDLWALKMEPA